MPSNWETYSYSYLTLQPSKQFIIIGTSGAAQHPTKHSTFEAAEKEANRLAKNKPGEEFVIFETKKSYKVEEKPVTVKVFV